jgi:hypothetical protein
MGGDGGCSVGRLIELSEFCVSDNHTGDLNALWYFPDARWDYRGNRRCKFTIESGYPALCAIHQDRLDTDNVKDAGALRMEIRRWIERNLTTDVILSYKNMEYRNPENDSLPRDYFIPPIKHGYHLFNFETDSDMMLFRLRFSDYVREIQTTHPNRFG